MIPQIPADFWDRDWSTPELAVQHTADWLGCDPRYLRAEGPPGGPYKLSFNADEQEAEVPCAAG